MVEVPPELIELVVLGRPQHRIAEQLEVTTRTVRRWLSDPQVALLVAEHREEVQRAIVGRLITLAEEAFDTVGCLLGEGTDSVRLRAAQMVVEQLAPAHRTLAARQEETYRARILAAGLLGELRLPAEEGQAT